MRRRACLLPPLVMLGGCARQGVLDPQGPVARSEALLLQDATAIMLTVIAPVIVMTLGFAWWFRRGNRHARRRPDFTYSGAIEMVVWSIPLLMIGFLGGIAWIASHELDPAKPLKSASAPIEVEVVALDWKWLFIYPREGIATVNRLVVPAGTPVQMRLTSAGVMNSLLVPQLGSQIYAMSGMATRLNLQADRPGSYAGFSAQFSGDGFSDMRFRMIAVSPADYRGWIARTRVAGGLLDQVAFDALARPSTSRSGSYAAVAPGLFDAVMQKSGDHHVR